MRNALGTESRHSLGKHPASHDGEHLRQGQSRAGNLESPGKLSFKVGSLGGAEKELAYESHLIHNSEQQPMSHISRQDYDSLQGAGATRGPMLTQY